MRLWMLMARQASTGALCLLWQTYGASCGRRAKGDHVEQRTYCIQLSWNMICALIDISEGYTEADSPRWHVRTLRALERRALVRRLPEDEKMRALLARGGQVVARLSKKGEAFLGAAEFTYEELRDLYEAANDRRVA